MEDGQLVELDDNVTFPGSSTFVSDITDESPLAGKLWNILCRAKTGLSTGDLQKACGLSSDSDLIALLSRWERKNMVIGFIVFDRDEKGVLHQLCWWWSPSAENRPKTFEERLEANNRKSPWDALTSLVRLLVLHDWPGEDAQISFLPQWDKIRPELKMRLEAIDWPRDPRDYTRYLLLSEDLASELKMCLEAIDWSAGAKTRFLVQWEKLVSRVYKQPSACGVLMLNESFGRGKTLHEKRIEANNRISPWRALTRLVRLLVLYDWLGEDAQISFLPQWDKIRPELKMRLEAIDWPRDPRDYTRYLLLSEDLASELKMCLEAIDWSAEAKTRFLVQWEELVSLVYKQPSACGIIMEIENFGLPAKLGPLERRK